MSSSKYDSIGNYNLSFETLKEAVNEFDGYIIGLSKNNVYTFVDSVEKDVANIPAPTYFNHAQQELADQEMKDKNLKNFLEEVAPRILDRTTGTYFVHDMLKQGSIKNLGKISDSGFIDSVMTIVPGTFPSGQSSEAGGLFDSVPSYKPDESVNKITAFKSSTADLGESNISIGMLPEGFQEDALSEIANSVDADISVVNLSDPNEQVENYNYLPEEDRIATMNECLFYYPTKSTKMDKLKNKEGEILYEDEEKKRPKMYPSDVNVYKNVLVRPEINGTGFFSSVPDRFDSPSLSAIVMKHPKASIAARGKDHLPIFFNAITPLEMSRCTPYITISVLSENYQIDKSGKKTAPSTLSNPAYMKFIKKGDDERYVLEDSYGFGDLKPVSNAIKDDERKATENVDISYMDIFASPQTLANGDINKDSYGIKDIDPFTGAPNNNDPVLDPIMPFVSLESLNISITGAGYGIMSSKSASLKMTLHDRSRLRDLAPLVSQSQFATTKIIIEYGWNHPDGGVNSDNPIGKYLNALKDRSVFQVIKCDYDFSDGGAVGINVGLVAYGFRQTERVHCGAGPEVPLNVFSEYINKVTDDLQKNAQKAGKEKAPEIRHKLKLNERSARSLSNSLSWESYRAIIEALKSKNPKSIKALEYVFELESITDLEKKDARLAEIEQELTKKIGNQLTLTDLENKFFGVTTLEIFNRLKSAGIFNDDSKESMIQRMYGKIKAFEQGQGVVDPFISATVYGSRISAFLRKLGNTKVPEPDRGFFNKTPQIQKNAFALNRGIDLRDADGVMNGTKYVTLGKAISSFIGYPMASTCLYDEVQLVFYPLNHQAAGGRAHTTASLPIPIKEIREKFEESIKLSSDISVKRAFSILEKIVKDKNLRVYGISDLYTGENGYDTFVKKSEVEKIVVMLDGILGGEFNSQLGFDPENNKVDADIYTNIQENEEINYSNEKSFTEGELSKPENQKRLRELLSEYSKQKSNETQNLLEEKLKNIYLEDGLADLFPGYNKFVRPNIAMDFEVVDAIRPSGSDDGESLGPVGEYFRRLKDNVIPPKNSDNGLYPNKTILRIHIYDEEAVMSPKEHTLLSSMTEGTTGRIVTLKSTKTKNSDEEKDPITNITNMNFNQAKQFIKRAYPTIIYGSSTSTVRNLSVTSNTSGELSNIIMVESYGNLKNAQVGGFNKESNFETVTIFPNTVSCTLMGMPMISRGNTIFIDFGTNTSLDNIYTVKDVTHTIRAGDFSTTLGLVPSNMGAVSAFASQMSETLSKFS